MCLLDLKRTPLRSCPIERPALLNYIVERSNGLLNRSGGVWPVSEDHIDVVESQALKGSLGTFDDANGRQSVSSIILIQISSAKLTVSSTAQSC